MNIEKMVHSHEITPFPCGCHSIKVDNVNLCVIDSESTACALSYLMLNGKLGSRRKQILSKCRDDLSTAIEQLEGEPKKYFEEIYSIADSILQTLH